MEPMIPKLPDKGGGSKVYPTGWMKPKGPYIEFDSGV